MESYYGLVAALIVVVIVALGLASASNRAEVVKDERKKNQKSSKDNKQKSSKQKSKSNKNSKKGQDVPTDIVFGSKNGKNQDDDDDQSMLELIQGTSKYYAKEAKEAALRKIQNEKVESKKQSKDKKTQQKQVVEESDDNSAYVSVKRSKKPTQDAAAITADADDSSVDQAGKKGKKEGDANAAQAPAQNAGAPEGQQKRKKAFLKSDVPPPREKKLGEKQPRQRRENSNFDGPEFAENGERAQRPPRQARPPRQEGDAEPSLDENGNERPRREPREPREPRPPRVFQAIPAPLTATQEDIPSLDDMLGALTSHYGTTVKRNFFSSFLDKEADRTRTKKNGLRVSASGREILIDIMSYLQPSDLARLSRVNQFLSKFTRDAQVWKNLCVRDYGLKIGKADHRKFKSVYRDELDKSKGRKPTSQNNTKPSTQQNNKPKSEKVEKIADASPIATEDNTEKKKKTQKKSKDV